MHQVAFEKKRYDVNRTCEKGRPQMRPNAHYITKVYLKEL